MRILHVITSLRTGGAEKLVVDITTGLRKDGFDTDVALFDGIDTPFKQQLEKTGCKIYSLGHSMYSPLCILKLMKIMGKYDIVHTHNTTPQLYAAIANLFARTKIVTTEHNTSNRRRNWAWFRPIDRWMYNRYEHVICISDQAQKNLKRYLTHTQARVSTIYNGIDCQRFHSAMPIDDMHPKAKTVITMVAAFRAQKDQDTLIKAMALLPKEEYELWLVGGDSERIGLMRDLAKNLNISDNVRFLGVRTDIPEILKTSDIIVMSSHYEGLSLSSIEGMSVGKPFVASDVDGLHEITEGAGILFQHQDEKELADIIMRLSKDKNLYEQTAKACSARAKDYDIATTIREYETIYQSL